MTFMTADLFFYTNIIIAYQLHLFFFHLHNLAFTRISLCAIISVALGKNTIRDTPNEPALACGDIEAGRKLYPPFFQPNYDQSRGISLPECLFS